MKTGPRSRPMGRSFFVATALVAVIVVVTIWLATAPDEPLPTPVIVTPKPTPRPVAALAPPPAQTVKPAATPIDPARIDPEIQSMADKLAAKSETPVRDLELVDEFIDLYRRVFQQGNPIGLNEDITGVLTGRNAPKGVLFPPTSPMIVKGQIVDRWGSPYWFHPNSSHQMEIRSAGPDKELFTTDDLVRNPGPDNMGIGAGG